MLVSDEVTAVCYVQGWYEPPQGTAYVAKVSHTEPADHRATGSCLPAVLPQGRKEPAGGSKVLVNVLKRPPHVTWVAHTVKEAPSVAKTVKGGPSKALLLPGAGEALDGRTSWHPLHYA